MLIQGQVGAPAGSNQPGATPAIRQGQLGDMIVSELHGRFYEQVYRNSLFSGGLSALTSISNATFTTATSGATATPILGIWNPLNSSVNCVVLQASLGVIITSLTNTGPGGFVWAISPNNGIITTGNSPLNRKTLQLTGSQAKDMSGLALTGMTGTLVPRFGSQLAGGSALNASFTGTAAGPVTTYNTTTENFDGSIFVPPGYVLGLFATTNAPVAHSAIGQIVWEEVPL
jgi:hypothetical protein